MTVEPGPEGTRMPGIDTTKSRVNQFDGLEIRFPFAHDVAGKALCVICGTGLANEGATINVEKNIVTLSHLPKDPSELLNSVQTAADQVMGDGSKEPIQLDFKRIPKKEIKI